MTAREAVERLLGDFIAALDVAGLSARLTADAVRAEEIVVALAPAASALERHVEWIVINTGAWMRLWSRATGSGGSFARSTHRACTRRPLPSVRATSRGFPAAAG